MTISNPKYSYKDVGLTEPTQYISQVVDGIEYRMELKDHEAVQYHRQVHNIKPNNSKGMFKNITFVLKQTPTDNER